MTAANRDIIVYTSPFCSPCEQLKQFLTSKGISFEVKDLLMDEDAQDRLDEARIRSTPALEIDGEIYAGEALSQEKVIDLLDL